MDAIGLGCIEITVDANRIGHRSHTLHVDAGLGDEFGHLIDRFRFDTFHLFQGAEVFD